MFPFITYRKVFVVKRDTYQLFNSINDLNLSESLFKNNAFDLIASVEQTIPLIMKFTRNNGGLGKGYSDATLLARFGNVNHNNTRIDIELRCRAIFIPVSIVLLGFIVGVIRQNLTLNSVSTIVFAISVLACVDIYKKSILLKRFEELIHSC